MVASSVFQLKGMILSRGIHSVGRNFRQKPRVRHFGCPANLISSSRLCLPHLPASLRLTGIDNAASTRRSFSANATSKQASRNDAPGKNETRTSILNHSGEIVDIPLSDVRNFCFIAHVDHGKSSLASRVLELAGNLGEESQEIALLASEQCEFSSDLTRAHENDSSSSRHDHAARQLLSLGGKEQIQLLDTLNVEQERGITVKASAASMLYPHASANGPSGMLLLNMVDTPGHADFGFEVTRSLASVQGAVILFDAAQGVQAQSLSVHEKAQNMGVELIPALTKVDLPTARPLDVALGVADLFGFDPDMVLQTSARSRIGIKRVLDAVCEQVPPPVELPDDDSVTVRVQVIDSWFEPLRGVVCLVQVLSGCISEGDRISVINQAETSTANSSNSGATSKDHFSVQDIGVVLPHRLRTGKLCRGQMGYAIVGMRDPRQAKSGSIVCLNKDISKVSNMVLPNMCGGHHHSSQSALYASVHPMEGDGFDELSSAVDRLALNDTGLEVYRSSGSGNSDGGPFLGPGLRIGFQGLLHVEVFRQRMLDEFGLEAIVTPPKVPYNISYLPSKQSRRPRDAPTDVVVEDLSQWPLPGERFTVKEPIVNVRVMAPVNYAGNVMELIKRKRGTGMETKPIDESTWLFTAHIPWAEVVTDFHDELKNTTAGYGSFDTSEEEPQPADLRKVDIMLNGDVVEPLAFVCHKDVAQSQARAVCKKLQEVLPRQQFVIAIQAKAGGKIVASEKIRAYRKDVLTTGGSKSVGGGDVSRKKKLLEKQKRGKKRQQATGKVTLSQEAFNSVISRS